ncbi:hypothetical protein EHI8A_191710 [Entamoeba histolytica HM-1:IMSS-B]|uniref:CBF1-interacting co-repressor CIR N-terminal domain-containing protein n=8 Tax=Entamoeba TaxID=5758 RepID=C4M838_ENTH1|nr:hypothetical protein ENU1_177540 [Entamoeba nuttalli P19]XP_651343.1 hypothetical protein EHI_108740 [Entamoeba histolytica HM-1:IMSS]EMD42792.1 Hypothetical protein EHI5A_220980 [Entamoeba histolytica KU27]EMH76624.1 hypothetical protein EHI8A_191710 [Entamoeba histolytica HM-1:IMSS-B]EMS15397.1 hypothetical protein KM1_268310 [Entamoeba histolytica HM-3:IMSS]ENY63891.1 hypothetical protein EHI7A_167620 [Entamoeba histolytica HM-1:IMSS-A]GAT97730.1 hypothetical protein CL6EHI_108740 [Enta|eukprot:XP_008859599.1 hypothetical protein ENU1_177540 [Entamoeba nuttalli P19]
MSFLSKKRWHVGNYKNRLKVELAELEAKEKEENEKNRLKEINEQKEILESIEKKLGKEKAIEVARQIQTSFVYEPPPGYSVFMEQKTEQKEKKREEEKPKKNNSFKDFKKKLKEDPIKKCGEKDIEQLLM